MTTSTPPPGGDSDHLSSWSFSTEGRVGEPSPRPRRGGRGPSRPGLDPLSNRLLQLAGLLSLLLIAVVVNAALHSDGNPLNPVAEAAQRTEQAPGARLAFTVTYGSSGEASAVVSHGSGAYNARTGRSRLVMSTLVPGRGSETWHGVADDRTLFMRSPAISAGLPPGKTWLAVQPFLGHASPTFSGGSADARSTLEMLQAAGDDVEEKGQAKVRGHETTIYAGTIDPGRLPALLERRGEAATARVYERLAKLSPAPVPVEVWVDENGLARRLHTVERLPASAGAPAITMAMTMELFDFRARPKVELPPRRAALDATPLARAELRLLNGETLAALTAPSGRPPMTAAVFRRRGNAICRGMKRAASPIARRSRALIARLKAGPDLSTLPPEQRLAQLQPFGPVLYRPMSELARAALRRFSRLSPPAGMAAPFARSLHGLAVAAERFQAQAVAVEVGAIPIFEQLENETKAANRREDDLARELGLPACAGHHDDFHSDASIE